MWFREAIYVHRSCVWAASSTDDQTTIDSDWRWRQSIGVVLRSISVHHSNWWCVSSLVPATMTLLRAETPAPTWCSRTLLVIILAACTATGSSQSADGSKSADGPETVYLGRGSAGRLDCPYTAHPPATLIVWLKDDQVIDPDSRIKVSKAGSLLIRAAEVADEGKYSCAVYSPSDSTESSPVVQLLVRGKHALSFIGCCV